MFIKVFQYILKSIETVLIRNYFYSNTINDFQNRNFSVSLLKCTHAMEMKQNQTFDHGIYSNLTPHHFLSKNIKVFQ